MRFRNHWKGGRIIDAQEYAHIWDPKNPMSDSKGYVKEHRLKMSQKVGRILTKEDVVHHINGIKDDNRIENLELMTHFQHKSLHSKTITHLDLVRFQKGCIPWNKGLKYSIKKVV